MGWDKLHPQECISSGQAGPCAISGLRVGQDQGGRGLIISQRPNQEFKYFRVAVTLVARVKVFISSTTGLGM